MMRKRSPWSSPRWKAYSRFMRRLHPWCSVKAPGCLRNERLEVHHIHYPPHPLPLWIVGPWNLVVACKPCHNKITQKHRGKHNPDRYVLATIAVMGAARFAFWRKVSVTFWSVVLGVPVIAWMALTYLVYTR